MPEHAAGRVSARPPARALEWVMGVMGPGSRIGSVRYLAGTSFHANHAIEVLDARGAPREVVLRRWAGAGWELTDAEFDAEREADILRLLEASPVPAPRLIADDPNAVGCDVPALLVTLLPGQPVDHPAELPGFLRELASVVAAIHAIDGRAAAIVPPYRRYCDPVTLGVPGWAAQPGLWKRAIEIARQPAPSGRECLIHRDLHPGNMLWSGGRVTGVGRLVVRVVGSGRGRHSAPALEPSRRLRRRGRGRSALRRRAPRPSSVLGSRRRARPRRAPG